MPYQGKPSEEEDVAAAEFGDVKAAEFVPGAELLSMFREREAESSAASAAADQVDARDDDQGSDGSGDEEEDGDAEDGGGDSDVEHDEGGAGGEIQDFDAGPEDTVEDTVSKEERRRRAVLLSQTVPLTQDDFDKIKFLQMESKLLPAGGLKRKRMNEEQREQRVAPYELLPQGKKQHATKEEKLAIIKGGHDEDDPKHGRKKGHEGEWMHGGRARILTLRAQLPTGMFCVRC